MYYLLIAVATVMFGIQFLFNKRYQKKEGEALEKAILFAMGTSAVIAVEMFFANGFCVEISWFSFIIAGCLAIIEILFAYCSVMVMAKVNLSLYSLFAMLGGMLLPFVGGIGFWGEALTLKKLLCLVIITTALFVGADLKADRKSLKYCFFVFVLNGLFGVLSKLHQSYADINISGRGLILLKSIITVVVCITAMPFFDKSKFKLCSLKNSVLNIVGFGFMAGFANLLVLTALVHVAASVQYPMITGGTILVSTVICIFTKEKTTYKNSLSTILTLAGTLMLL